MNRMGIKLKMALAYGAFTAILLIFFLIISYSWLSKSMYNDLKSDARKTAEQLASELTRDNSGKVKIPSNYSYTKGGIVTVLNKDGDVLYDNSGFTWINQKPYLTNEFWIKTEETQKWLVYDKMIVRNYHEVDAIVRVCISENQTTSKLETIKIMLFAGGALFIVLAMCGGYFISKKSLKPIFKITETAKKIENGDLTARISEELSKDEVGNLAIAFNSMIENLETSFNREKQFAADASHELRTPIAIIMNNSEQLIHNAKGTYEDSLEEYEVILSESKRMNKIVSQLLSLTRANEKNFQLNIEKFELCEVIEIVNDQLTDSANKKGINICFTKEKDIMIEADQTLITQLFLNIIENAIKYSKQDSMVTIGISENEDSIIITISDNGIGISEADLPHIFERFYRADKSRDRTGTGLGLSIAKWIVDVHHGEISVKSRLDKGTTFMISLKKCYLSKS